MRVAKASKQILILLVVFSTVRALRFAENYNCNYDGCPGQHFVCGTDGRDFQYFRNVCYLRNFNHCNKARK